MNLRGSSRRLTVFMALLPALLVPSSAAAATVVNGDFESGSLSGWHLQRSTESANWFAYKGTEAPIKGSRDKNLPVQPPPQGTYAAVTDEAIPDTLILHQDVALEAGRSHFLSLLAYYDSEDPIAVPTPDTLSVDEGVLGQGGNQQFRIDVMRPEAPLDSLNPGDILRTLFRTKQGDPTRLTPTRLTVDLSPFAGQTVRLRIANAAHEGTFHAGVDAVSISEAPPGQSSPRGSKNGPNSFSFGKVKLNRRNGTATLQVQVSGPGRLSAKGTSASGPRAGASKVKRPRSSIKPVSVQVATAKTVTIRLEPTQAARKILRQKHKLRVRVTVTFTPRGDSAETQSVPVTLRLRRARHH